ncbi:signal recognition particle receptor subunit alpha homolog isoform X2 [Leguminivora glycinivorella]|uniref:signal recognition particle receptor subunit alpha homolog isoform X1 n=1 Tax=Leguminivora glycinivorella TaxID=1035111 RepID=UPI00200D6EF6|nr:signal recognition particle receptor subunit alpha homolog isoform X1 [Leguminivora glycinivorella]XP_047997686.1 signal recognition particle receptor subunit alpha homolog isoform X2 [Leguminivora glycinivorella]
MLDLFSIFSKGGIVLWCFQGTSEIFSPSVNALIRSVILQERSGNTTFNHNSLTLQYKLDNEFELVFVVAYQRILQLSYVDKFLNDVHLEFRDKYKNELQGGRHVGDFEFKACFDAVLKGCEQWAKSQAKIPKQMRTFEDSQKSKKTVASMIERKGEEKGKKSVKIVEAKLTNGKPEEPEEDDSDVLAARAKLAQKLNKTKKDVKKSPKSPKVEKDRTKKPRVWELGGGTRDLPELDFSTDKPEDSNIIADTHLVGRMTGAIRDLEVESEESSSDEEEEQSAPSPKKTGGMFSIFKGLVGSKALTEESMRPVLDKMRDHLIAKNVAADIANKLCESVQAKLQGKVLGTFDSVAKTIKATLTESLVQILSPRRRVDILRDAMHAKQEGQPYVMAFCGVNGVGKSTNLAKICFWLIENNMSVLIAACDTFRAGAVEQLRTHTRHLNALHPEQRHNRTMVQLYEKGYGKDAAGIAMEAIRYAADSKIDVVLIDTAGRMQDNEPLMRALAKLIKVNEPDMVLFVGEALVGNEAVDQLVKFNQALADHSSTANPHTIDGIVLTKFDTIDDKVGAAISMTYITGQPIVFVGTGQTYTDLKALNANAVVHALMK